ncbi:MAG: transporter permease [Sphingobacterium sp.]|jgi:phospholipid/cholesterol/gamma-HCH transport system substrate-binding protein|uniref:MlaD family protein n=1 Tax=unclassified Sphingobacterium TaxID=2609468 RepID=UPI00098564F3|nr:MlaD family protein [Sphingobacterium sp. CZ-UAM]MDF2517686.1 transporter permease [Sphingobacterium sp.]OOG16249.1 ABC transporter permease [Sphingobacterium sp. CZ-UAM]
MSKAENKRAIIVGIFVFLGVLILLAGIFILGSQQKKFTKNIEITTSFPDVAGLKVGSNVWFSGVKVGIIKNIHFKSVQDVEVVLTIEEKSAEYIRKDAVTKLGSDGLIGNKIVVISGGSQNAPTVETGDFLRSAKTADMEAMMETLQVNNENLAKITTDFVEISRGLADGKGMVGAMLTDTAMVNTLRASLLSISAAMNNANKASANLVTLTNSLNSNKGLIHDLTTDTAIFSNLRQSAAQLQGVSQTANALINNLNNASSRLNDKDNAVGVLLNDPASANQIKSAINNLNSSTEKLDENMEALQHNFLLRGFFKKKMKENAKKAEELKADSAQ